MSVTPEDIPELCERLEKAVALAKQRKTACTNEFGSDFTDWRLERPFMRLDFIHEPIDILGFENDDVIEALLTCFMGGESNLISANTAIDNKYQSFTIRNITDPMELEFTKKVLALPQYYSALAKFTENNYMLFNGRINGALAAGIDAVLDDYMSFVTCLEQRHRSSKITVYELWYYIQPILETMKVLSGLLDLINEAKSRGAQTLNILYEYYYNLTVCNLEKQICLHLLSDSAVPYMVSIQKWIFNGEIYDPYKEFMIVENVIQTNQNCWKHVEDYWEKKYIILDERVPTFLQSCTSEILNAGKYLNVIKECAPEKCQRLPAFVCISFDPTGSYKNLIKNACTHSSHELLKYMMTEHKIKEKIIWLKSHLLLQNGEFVVQLFDACESELAKEISEIVPARLKTLVESVVKQPNDGFTHDDIEMSLQRLTLAEQVHRIFSGSEDFAEPQMEMTGFESFALNINYDWPVSLILHSKVISSYQMLFRLMFYCKYIERMLCSVWLTNMPIRTLLDFEGRTYAKSNALRHKMMIFIQNIEYYMMEEAVETNWMEFISGISKAKTIEALIETHWNFLDLSMKDCLITDCSLFVKLQELLLCCKKFVDFILTMRKVHMEADSDMIDSDSSYIEAKTTNEDKQFPTFDEKIQQLDQNFESTITSLIIALENVILNDKTTKLEKLASRLQFVFIKEKEPVLPSSDSEIEWF